MGVGVEGRSDPGKVRKGFQFQTSQWMNGKTIQHCPQPITAVQSLSNTVTAVQSLPTLSTACYSCTVPFQHCYSYTVFFQHCYSCSLFPRLLQLYSLFRTLSTACCSCTVSFQHCPQLVTAWLQPTLSTACYSCTVSFQHCPQLVTACLFPTLSTACYSMSLSITVYRLLQLYSLFSTLSTACYSVSLSNTAHSWTSRAWSNPLSSPWQRAQGASSQRKRARDSPCLKTPINRQRSAHSSHQGAGISPSEMGGGMFTSLKMQTTRQLMSTSLKMHTMRQLFRRKVNITINTYNETTDSKTEWWPNYEHIQWDNCSATVSSWILPPANHTGSQHDQSNIQYSVYSSHIVQNKTCQSISQACFQSNSHQQTMSVSLSLLPQAHHPAAAAVTYWHLAPSKTLAASSPITSCLM